MNNKRQKQWTVAGIALLVLLTLAIVWFVGRPLIRNLKQPDVFRAWIDSHGFWGKLAFLGICVLHIIVAIIPGEPIELFAGYAFGFWWGTLMCEIGIVAGGAVVYAFVHRFGRKALNVFFSEEKINSLRFLQDEEKLELWVFILFFIPGTPKDMITWFVPLTRMTLGRFLLISGLARLPSVVTSTIGGNALGSGRVWFAVLVFVITGAISAIGIVAYRRIKMKKEAGKTEKMNNE